MVRSVCGFNSQDRGAARAPEHAAPAHAPAAAAAKHPEYVLVALVKDGTTHGPLKGAKWELAKKGEESKVLAQGETDAQAIVEQRVKEAGQYVLRVVEVVGAALYPPSRKPLAEKTIAAREKGKEANPTEVEVKPGIRPKLVYKNEHEKGWPVGGRNIYLVPAGQGAVAAEAHTDPKGLASLWLDPAAPAFDLYASKRAIAASALGEDIARLREGKLTRYLDGLAKGAKPAETIELTRLHRDRIERALFPTVRDCVPVIAGMRADGVQMSIDVATCNVCAGVARTLLLELGYREARFNDTKLHVTVRAKTPDGETLVIDASMPQFMINGSTIDAELKQRGGWMGTEKEVEEFCRKYIDYNNCHQKPPEPWDMVKAREILIIMYTAADFLGEAKKQGRSENEREVQVVRQLYDDACAQLEGALRFVALLDEPAHDVFGYAGKKDLWARYQTEAKDPSSRIYTAPELARMTITERLKERRKDWLEGQYAEGQLVARGAIDIMMDLFREANNTSQLSLSAQGNIDAYRAWKEEQDPGHAWAAAFAKIHAAVDTEGDPPRE